MRASKETLTTSTPAPDQHHFQHQNKRFFAAMSHGHYTPQDAAKEPHPISLKVLRLSRPSLVSQFPVAEPLSAVVPAPTMPASLAFRSAAEPTNTDPFLLSPLLNLPPSFGSAYVGETFSCTLCVNYDNENVKNDDGEEDTARAKGKKKAVRDVRIEAEMKTQGAVKAVKLALLPEASGSNSTGVDLQPGQTLQKIVRFDLKEEGNHVLAVTVSYYEATETSGRTRTFRKLYQFICKSSLIVRTKAGPFGVATSHRNSGSSGGSSSDGGGDKPGKVLRRWVLEAQLENSGEDVIQLERVVLDLEPSLVYEDCNWDDEDVVPCSSSSSASATTTAVVRKPVLHPGEVEQVCFLLEETGPGLEEQANGRVIFGVLGIGWRGEMGNRGFLSTGKLGTRAVR